jgi:hypothetical protein
MLAEVLATAALGEYDQDAATSGLCGTFALAMKAVCPEVSLGLICLTDKTGAVLHGRDDIPYWRHVVAKLDDELFDVDGRVELAHVVENYCWGNPCGGHGDFLPVTEKRLREILLSDRKSYDEIWLSKWIDVLGSAYAAISEREPELTSALPG